MSEIEYSEAAVEVLDILNHTNKEDVERIPQSFIKFLTDIASRSYKVKFDYEQPINGFNLKQQTKELLGFIYITWWCDKKEHEEYKKLIYESNMRNIKIKENYNVNDIFKNKRENQELKASQNEQKEQTSLVGYKQENVFKKIINKIINFFTGKKERR